ncbi:MAG: DUF885 domain-containing protein [Myxococcota bacterium]
MTTFDQVNEDQLNALLDLAPEVGTALGLVERDDQWPDPSDAAVQQSHATLREWSKALSRLPEVDLNPDQRLDRRVFQAHLELVEFTDQELNSRRHDPDLLTRAGWTLFQQLRSTFVPAEQRFSNLAARLNGLGEYLTRGRAAVTDPDALWLEVAKEVAAATPGLFSAVKASAREEDIPATLRDEVDAAAARAGQAVADHTLWLQGLSPSAKPRWVLGPERFAELCRRRMLGRTPEELLEFGEKYVLEYQAERRRFGRRIMREDPVKGALKKLRSDCPRTFPEALDRVREAVSAARSFVQANDLCPLPGRELLLVDETPAPFRPLVPFAALQCAPKFAPEQTSIYMVTPPVAGASLEDFYQADLENTAVHEGYPGHHLQLSIANLHTGLLRDGVPLGFFADQSAGWAVETVEGWAHYAEEMLREAGFRDSDAAHMQIAHDALWRAHRVVIDVGLATGNMTVEQAVARLVEDIGMPRAAALAEVRRYTRTPGYALCYLLGKHLMFELRQRARVLWRSDFTLRRFHQLVLTTGNVPMHFIANQLELGGYTE